LIATWYFCTHFLIVSIVFFFLFVGEKKPATLIIHCSKKGKKDKLRYLLHALFAVLLLVAILLFNVYAEGAVIDIVLGLANYTYGPLIGLFALGIFTKLKPQPGSVILVSVLVPLFCWYLGKNAYVSDLIGIAPLRWNYQFGYELILINGFLSFLGYAVLSKITKRF
jgi:hypothetical protein